MKRTQNVVVKNKILLSICPKLFHIVGKLQYLTGKDTFCALLTVDKRVRKDVTLDYESIPMLTGTRCAQECSLALRPIGLE